MRKLIVLFACTFMICLTPLVIVGIGVGLIIGVFGSGVRYGINLPHALLTFATKP